MRRRRLAAGALRLLVIAAGLGAAAAGAASARATAPTVTSPAARATAPAVTSPAARATAPAVTSPAVRAAAAVARQGLLRRSDLGAGWSMATAAPHDASSLTCGSDRGVLAAVASATWSQATATAFASGTSYGFAGPARQRRMWRQTATAAMGRCLERQLEQGSSHGVVLHATAVRMLRAPRLPPGAARASIRRYEVSGTASGAGQDGTVTLDVVLVGYQTWIGEDEFSVADAASPSAVEQRVAGGQDRRLTR